VAPLNIAQVRGRLNTARWHYQRAQAVRNNFPDDHEFHFEKGYDALRAAAGGVVAAHGVRTTTRGRTHAIPFAIAIAALRSRRPDAANKLDPIAARIREWRNRMQYEIVDEVTADECEELFGDLPMMLEAMEAIAYDLIGLPPTGGW